MQAWAMVQLHGAAKAIQGVFRRRKNKSLAITELFKRRDEIKGAMARRVQNMLRRRIARKRVAEVAQKVLQKFRDADTGLPYWYNPRTETTSWYKPWLLREKVEQQAISGRRSS